MQGGILSAAAPLVPTEIKAELDQDVIGQERAKKILSVALHSHIIRVRNAEQMQAAMSDKRNSTLTTSPSTSTCTCLSMNACQPVCATNLPAKLHGACTSRSMQLHCSAAAMRDPASGHSALHACRRGVRSHTRQSGHTGCGSSARVPRQPGCGVQASI
jgi:hypothetical protein